MEQVNPVEICDSYSILSLLALTKKGSTCWPHTHADIHSHTSTLQSSILLFLFCKRESRPNKPTGQKTKKIIFNKCKYLWLTALRTECKKNKTYLCQLLSFVVQRVHNFAHVLDGFKSCLIGLINRRLLKYNQNSLSLVKDAYNKETHTHTTVYDCTNMHCIAKRL